MSIHDSFHETTRLVHFQRAGHVIHRHFGYLDVTAFRAGLRLAQAYPSQLRVDEDRIGYQAIMNACIPVFEEIGANNAEIVVGDMGESGATLYIPERVDTRNIGFQLLIGLNKAFFIYLYSCRSKIEPIGVGSAPCCHEQVRSAESTVTCRSLYSQLNFAIAGPGGTSWSRL